MARNLGHHHVQVCWLDCDFIMQMKLQVHTAIIFALCGHKSCCPVAPKENECGARAAVAHQQKSALQLFLEGTLAADTASQATLPRTAHALSATLDPTIGSDLPSSAVATPEPVTFTPVAASGQTPTPAAPTTYDSRFVPSTSCCSQRVATPLLPTIAQTM